MMATAPAAPDQDGQERQALECLTQLPPCLTTLGHAPPAAPPASPPPPTSIHNIVSTSIIRGTKMPIDLNELSTLLPCSSYDRRRFAAITVRIDRPRCTALLFTSGKLVVTGVKSWNECLLASIVISRLMNRVLVGQAYFVVNCQIQNIVAHSDARLAQGQTLDIQAMYEDIPMECTYQKNMFPGLIYRAKDCPVVLLCFYSGKVVLTGGKTVSDISTGWDRLWAVVSKYIR